MSLMSVILVLFYITPTIFGCKQILIPLDKYSEPQPYMALDVCLQGRYLGLEFSYTYTCDNDGNLIYPEWLDNLNCSGDPDYGESTTTSMGSGSEIECFGNQCQSVILRTYFATACSTKGGYQDSPLVVNECVNTLTTEGYSTHSIIQICTNTTVTQYSYAQTDCTGEIKGYITLYEDGECYDDHHIDIIHCGMKGGDRYSDIVSDPDFTMDIVYTSMILIIKFIGLVVCVCITKKIFSNLFKCKVCKIKNYEHNWIIPPSMANRIYALLTPTFFILALLVEITFVSLQFNQDLFIKWMESDSWKYFYYMTPFIIRVFTIPANIFYYLYMISTLEYHMADESIQIMIPKKLILLIKILNISIALEWIINLILYIFDVNIFYNGIYRNTSTAIGLVRNSFMELGCLYLYYSGLNNLCHYWYSKHWKEFDKYGENERTHQIVISLSRVAVIVIISFMFSMIYVVEDSIHTYIMWKNTFAAAVMDSSFFIISCITKSLTIYFIYPFSHRIYEKICGRCQQRAFKYLTKSLQHQVKHGAIDGLKYKPNNSKCVCFDYLCCKINKENVQLEHMLINENNDEITDAAL